MFKGTRIRFIIVFTSLSLLNTTAYADKISQSQFESKLTQAQDFSGDGAREYEYSMKFLDRADYDSACEHLRLAWRGLLEATNIYRELSQYDNVPQGFRSQLSDFAASYSKNADTVWAQKEDACKTAKQLKE